MKRHLDAQLGAQQMVLTEDPRMGRTEQFAEVVFEDDQPEGALMSVQISGHDGRKLKGLPLGENTPRRSGGAELLQRGGAQSSAQI